jgi:hypothetical protein
MGKQGRQAARISDAGSVGWRGLSFSAGRDRQREGQAEGQAHDVLEGA